MFPVVKHGEGGRKLSFFEDRENDVGRSPESFGQSKCFFAMVAADNESIFGVFCADPS